MAEVGISREPLLGDDKQSLNASGVSQNIISGSSTSAEGITVTASDLRESESCPSRVKRFTCKYIFCPIFLFFLLDIGFRIGFLCWYTYGVTFLYSEVIIKDGVKRAKVFEDGRSQIFYKMQDDFTDLLERKQSESSSTHHKKLKDVDTDNDFESKFPYSSPNDPAFMKLFLDPEFLIAQMTFEEKLYMLHGESPYAQYGGIVRGVARLGIPPLVMNDGPQGFNVWTALLTPSALLPYQWMRVLFAQLGQLLAKTSHFNSNPEDIEQVPGYSMYSDGNGGNVLCNVFENPEGDPCQVLTTTTSLPAALAVAATFSRKAAILNADIMAREFKIKGANTILGPALNLHRVPYGGRNFEYLPGEDAVLGAELAKVIVHRLVKRHKLMVTIKH